MDVSVAARLNRLPPTRTHRQLMVITGIGSFFDLFDIFLARVLGTVLTQQFQLDRVSLSAALSSAFVGVFIGATVPGRPRRSPWTTNGVPAEPLAAVTLACAQQIRRSTTLSKTSSEGCTNSAFAFW